MKKLDYVWYASYGSNLNEERFLCYVKGGQPVGSQDTEPGCRDHTLPVDNKPILIPYPLYFSGDSQRWGGGAAFVGHQQEENNPTLGRMYLITSEQFIDVVSQENQGLEVDVDLNEVQALGSKQVFDSRYGTIICLGTETEVPIFTFTANDDQKDMEWSAPSAAYLGTIITGLIDTYSHTNEQLVQYLMDKPSVQDKWTHEELNLLIESKRR